MRRLIVIAALVMSGCAGIPTAGPVNQVAATEGLSESTVRYTPAPPADGAAPAAIVRGFLDAMLAYPVSTGVAATYLTPRGARDWRPSAATVVYSTPKVVATSPTTDDAGEAVNGSENTTKATVRLDVKQESVLDRQGHFTSGTGESTVRFSLVQVEGEWRIDNPPDGVLVTRKFFSDYFRPFTIYLFDRPGERLVADPVYLPTGDQLATALVTSLTRGPRDAVAAQAATYVPELSRLRPSVPVTSEGVAEVDFDVDLSAMEDRDRQRLSAQIVWTLRQVPGVIGVRLSGQDVPVTAGGNPVQPIGSWRAFGPSAARSSSYAIANNQVVQLQRSSVEPLAGPWGRDAQGAVSIGLSSSGIAAVLSGRDRVRVSDRDGSNPLTIAGTSLLAPWWDDDNKVWLVDIAAGRSRVRMVDGPTVRTIDAPALAGVAVTSFSVSPGSTRYSVTAGQGIDSTLWVGAVERDAAGMVERLGDPVRITTTAQAPRAAGWASSTDIGYLASTELGSQVFTTRIDGSLTEGGRSGGQALLPDVDASSLSIERGGSDARYVTDARDRLWYLPSGGSWSLVDSVAVTGLTIGR